ncbi:hypothetical protein Tco_0421092 [Tanacetum coccineum]
MGLLGSLPKLLEKIRWIFNKMTHALEPEETGVGGLQLPGKDLVVFRPSERITIRYALVYLARYACTSHAERILLIPTYERCEE